MNERFSLGCQLVDQVSTTTGGAIRKSITDKSPANAIHAAGYFLRCYIDDWKHLGWVVPDDKEEAESQRLADERYFEDWMFAGYLLDQALNLPTVVRAIHDAMPNGLETLAELNLILYEYAMELHANHRLFGTLDEPGVLVRLELETQLEKKAEWLRLVALLMNGKSSDNDEDRSSDIEEKLTGLVLGCYKILNKNKGKKVAFEDFYPAWGDDPNKTPSYSAINGRLKDLRLQLFGSGLSLKISMKDEYARLYDTG